MPKGNAIAAAVLAASGRSGSGGTANSAGLSPLVASYSQSYSANVPYSPLPRPPATFLNGAFGPMDPIVPMPINQPREDTHRPDTRRFQAPVGWNLPAGTPGEGKLAPFATLRALADTYSVARSCVDKRKQEIVALDWDIVPTDEAEQALMGDESARADWEKRRAVVKEFFSHPDSDRAKYATFGAWMSAILEDRFVIDAVAIRLVPPRKKGAGPFGSDLASLDVLDGTTIQPLLDINATTPKPSAPAYQQYLYGVPRVDLISPITQEELADLGEPAGDFRADQLIYMRETVRNQSPWGFSCIEKALLPISIGLARQQYQNLYFQDGSIPGMFVTPGPDIATPQQVRQLQDALNAMAGDIGSKHRMIVFPHGTTAEMQKPFPLADQFDEWIISQVTMPFGLTPMDVGVTPRVSAVQSPSESRELSQINSDKGSQTRIEPVCADLKAVLFDYVIQQIFKQRDMQWSWGLTDRGKNRQLAIDQGVQLVQVGGKTLDELRIDLGDTPYGLPETSVPLVYTATGPIPLSAIASEQPAPLGTAQPAALPPGAQAPGDQKPPQVTDDQLTTPAHEAARALPETPGSVESADAQKQAAELEILGRYLRKGRDLSKFRPEALPAQAVEAAARALPQGVPAAVKAARDATEAKRRQDRRKHHLETAAAYVAAGLGHLVRNHNHAALSPMHVVDGGVKVMADGYRQAMAAGTKDASQDYPDTPAFGDAGLDGDARQQAEGQRGFLMGLMQDVIGGLSLAAIGARLAQYASTLFGAYNQTYGQTVQAAHPTYEIVWELGDADHCAPCLDRAGKVFTFQTLPGYPGTGGFGEVCDGGSNCKCSLTYRRVDPDGGTTKVLPPAAPPSGASAHVESPSGTAGDGARGSGLDQAVERMFAKLAHLDITKADLRAVVRDAVAPGANGLGLPAADPDAVYRQLAANYEPEGIAWVREMPWRGPGDVPLDAIDWGAEGTWAASQPGANTAHVARFEQRIREGAADVNPAVLVQVPGQDKLKVIDGHHRAMADNRLGRPVRAYVGLADSDRADAAWFQAHLYQRHSGGDPMNKAAAEDPSRVAFLLLRAPNENGRPRFLLQKRDDGAPHGGTWGLPGGKTHVNESPWAAAVREAGEELGDLPAVKPAAVWSRAEEDHVVFTYLVDLPRMFNPSADGATGGETAGWGWFKRKDVAELPLHPAMRETWESLDFDDERLGGKDPGAAKAARGYELNPRSGMISLDLPDGLIEPIPGGIAGDDEHVTVVYLGGDVDDQAFATACERAAQAAAAAPGPLVGVISGLGTFEPSGSSDGKTVVWAGVTLPGAEQIRAALEDLSASEHAQWHPHVTRAYIDAGDPLPEPVPATPVTFTHLSVHRGDEIVRFPLGASGAGNAQP